MQFFPNDVLRYIIRLSNDDDHRKANITQRVSVEWCTLSRQSVWSTRSLQEMQRVVMRLLIEGFRLPGKYSQKYVVTQLITLFSQMGPAPPQADLEFGKYFYAFGAVATEIVRYPEIPGLCDMHVLEDAWEQYLHKFVGVSSNYLVNPIELPDVPEITLMSDESSDDFSFSDSDSD